MISQMLPEKLMIWKKSERILNCTVFAWWNLWWSRRKEGKTNKAKLDNLYDNLYDTPTHLVEDSYDKDLVQNNMKDVKNKNIAPTTDTTVVHFSQELPDIEKPQTEIINDNEIVFVKSMENRTEFEILKLTIDET